MQLTFVQQGKDQAHGLARRQDQRAFVLVSVDFVKLALVKGSIVFLMSLQRESGLDEPMAQVGVAFAGEAAVLPLEAARSVFGPPEAGHFGHTGLAIAIFTLAPALGLAVVLAAGDEAAGILDLTQTASDEDGAETVVGQGEVGLG